MSFDTISIKTLMPPENTDATPVKKIRLSNGEYTIVDADDYQALVKWEWHSQRGYPVRYAPEEVCFMHRVVAKTPIGMITDHINGNKLDNRKSNLRVCTNSENVRNQAVQNRKKPKTSKYKGVHFRKSHNKWRAQIRLNNLQVFCKDYETEMEAAIAYNEAAIKFHGEFARLNDI